MTTRAGRATAEAAANIAFIKYWGTRDPEATLPYNPSISMTLSRCVSRCTIERAVEGRGEVLFRPAGGDLAAAAPAFARGVERHLAALSRWAGLEGPFRVVCENTFPTGAGIASSASGFAALATAFCALAGREVSARELSVLARLSGSGSAARSALGGFVEWPEGGDDAEGYSVPLAPAGHWELHDLVAVVDDSPKEVSSRQGHEAAPSSPYFQPRLELLAERLAVVRRAVGARDLAELGPVIEEEAIDLHLIAMSSRPPIFYWRPATLTVLAAVRELRRAGTAVWATIDAGPNVHLICEPPEVERVAAEIGSLPEVERLIRDRVGEGPRVLGEHLS